MAAWKKTYITTDDNQIVEASAPEIISASRSTDIPGFYHEWFFNRLEKGYSAWINPFNNQKSYISYENTRFVVFWSKNPASLLQQKYIDILNKRNIKIYIQYTLNDYEDEKLEENVPSLTDRIETFKKLSLQYGKDAVIWRFDPLMLTETCSVYTLLTKIKNIAEQIKDYTNKLVFSFADISTYSKVRNNLEYHKVPYIECEIETMKMFARNLSLMNNKENWNFKLATCSEKINLDEYGIEHNHCIDDELITKIAYKDEVLMNFLGMEIHDTSENLLDSNMPDDAIKLTDTLYAIRTKSNKDSGQRLLCGCMKSKDIGQYNTCIHQCKYCYANTNNEEALRNYKKHLANPYSETIFS